MASKWLVIGLLVVALGATVVGTISREPNLIAVATMAVAAIAARLIMARNSVARPSLDDLDTRVLEILREAQDKDEATQLRAQQEALDLVKEAKRNLRKGYPQ